MPTEYTCSSCNLTISTGSYHSFNGEWITALYCRNCGAQYSLASSTSEFFDRFITKKSEEEIRKYTLRGPLETQEIEIVKEQPIPELGCDVCKSKGPFGETGPLTGKAPKGLDVDQFIFDHSDTAPTGECPRCKNSTMVFSDEWIT